MSAVSGIHSGKHSKPTLVPENFNGLASVMPEDWIPTGATRVTYKGKNGDVHAPTLCIGAWSWGDKATWHWNPEDEPAAEEAWRYCVSKGVNFIDTAQAYGTGESEAICGRFFKNMDRDSFVVQTKYYVVPQRKDVLHPTHAPLKKLETSLKNLGLDYVDIYLVHGPIHIQSIERIAKGMAECVDKGLAKCIGVANYDTGDMIKMQEELTKYGVPLALNQCEFSLARRRPETSGLLKACKDRGVVFQSYSSLAQGRLTGKYSKDNPPPKEYRFSSYAMEDFEPLVSVLKHIADKRQTSVSAVALNYNLCKGITPVVGVRKLEQAVSNCQTLGWRLSKEEIEQLDAVSFEGHTTKLWQQG
ncbi:Aldo/keto reductase [Westerdykella ornata]|uniref:Aldo/keto reductase n=1 Tax=Westerdykella ornata TaxID=318751 RepID=A0A6A6JXQ1_WESOR|nr:Aldo/keto reductase [Westerdykella ornata]KAF2279849.1 Aldo/keto reductase [Westerdykella ornata]